jgi:hypothetical protein
VEHPPPPAAGCAAGTALGRLSTAAVDIYFSRVLPCHLYLFANPSTSQRFSDQVSRVIN